ncbi:MAG: low specificity L-threonine aldolase [Actinobacteria bacterium]|nr:low specificity L-threonine aldolase [Actinomycetota bacterium]
MASTRPIELRSDNCAGVAPEILAAIESANTGSALAYGGDAITTQLGELTREVFQDPEARIFPVHTGTAANSLALSALCPPWGSVLCHETAHIFVNEGGATSMFGAGAVMRGLSGSDFKLHVEQIQHAFDTALWDDAHFSQPSVLSITCPTDFGTLYTPAEVKTLADLAASRKLRMHLDGARLANALAALKCTPADLTKRAGVNAFSLGATKNGALSCDAIVSFDAQASDQLFYRIKRAGQVASKMRFQSVQLVAYMTDGLWLRLAQRANEAMQLLATGLRNLGTQLVADPQANMLFARVGQPALDRLAAANILFYPMGDGVLRFVTSFQTTDEDVAEVLRRAEIALNPS